MHNVINWKNIYHYITILNKEMKDLTLSLVHVLDRLIARGWGATGNLSRQVAVRDRAVCVNGNTNVFLVLSILIWNTEKRTPFYRALCTNSVHHVHCSRADVYSQQHSNLKLTKYFKKGTSVTRELILIIETPFKAQTMSLGIECHQS